MEVLIIEDDEIKMKQIKDYITVEFQDFNICKAKSLQSGIKTLLKDKFDLILLDMTLPTFDYGVNEDGGRTRIYGGREILRQMERRKIDTFVIIITQFDRFGKGIDLLTLSELDKKLKSEHNKLYIGSVYYNATSDDWKNNLKDLIKKI